MRLVDIYWYVVPELPKDISTSASGTSSRRSAWAGCGWRTSSITCGSGRCCRRTIRKCRCCLHQRPWALTPITAIPCAIRQVDFDRTDLSARGILLFLVGLLVAGIFIELVMWGMFRFLSHSTSVSARRKPIRWCRSQKAPTAAGSALDIAEHSGGRSLECFPSRVCRPTTR